MSISSSRILRNAARLSALMILGSPFLMACQKEEGAGEKAGKAIDKAADSVKKEAGKAADKVKDAAK